jgi:SSS family solute:Na+ symporter
MDAMKPLLAQANLATSLSGLDWLMIALYFGLLLGVAWWVIRKGKEMADDHSLAGRNLSWWIVGASIFASNVGPEHVVGLVGSGAADGVAMAHYELHAWCLLEASPFWQQVIKGGVILAAVAIDKVNSRDA